MMYATACRVFLIFFLYFNAGRVDLCSLCCGLWLMLVMVVEMGDRDNIAKTKEKRLDKMGTTQTQGGNIEFLVFGVPCVYRTVAKQLPETSSTSRMGGEACSAVVTFHIY